MRKKHSSRDEQEIRDAKAEQSFDENEIPLEMIACVASPLKHDYSR